MEYIVYIAFWLILLVMAIIACALFCIMVDMVREEKGKAKGVSERKLSDELLMQYLDIRFSDETEEDSIKRKIDTLECLAIELRMKYNACEVASNFKHIKNKKHGRKKQKANSE